jgi:hypothetical protein
MSENSTDNQWLEAIAKQQELGNKLLKVQIEATEKNTQQVKIAGTYVLLALFAAIAIFIALLI